MANRIPARVPVAHEFSYMTVWDNLRRRPNAFAERVRCLLLDNTQGRGSQADIYIRDLFRGGRGKSSRGLLSGLETLARRLRTTCRTVHGFRARGIVRIAVPTTLGEMAVVAVRFERRIGCLALLLGAALCVPSCRGDPPDFPVPNYGSEDAGVPPSRDSGGGGGRTDAGLGKRLDEGVVTRRDAGIGEREVLPGAADRILIRGGIIVTVNETGEVDLFEGGELFVNGDTIDCVSETICDITDGATIVQLGPNDKLYSGLIDTHNHPHYNFCPVFEHSETYQHNGQWRGSDEYDLWGETFYDPNDDLVCEKYQYGLVASLFGAATTLQGIGVNRRCLRQGESEPLLGRMPDSIDGLGPDHVRTWALGIDSVPDEDAQAFCDAVDDGEEDRVFIHIGEGRRGNENVEEEFDTLRGLASGCLMDSSRAGALVFIHGNFTRETLEEIAALGDSPEERPIIVWSPSSNTDLYGWNVEASLSVPDALELGIRVALGPDWRPSHGIGMITEINRARDFADEFFPAGSVSDEAIFRMVTANAADAAGLKEDLGRLAPGMLADLAIIKGGTTNPFERAYLGDVAGVMIGGKFYYGDDWLMEATSFSSDYCEELAVCDVPKRVCIPDTVDGEPVSFSSLEAGTFFYLSGGTATPYLPEPFDTLPFACGSD